MESGLSSVLVSGVISCKAEMWSRSRSLGLETVSTRDVFMDHLGLVSVSRKSAKVSVSSRTKSQKCRSCLNLRPHCLTDICGVRLGYHEVPMQNHITVICSAVLK